MARVKKGVNAHKKHKKILKLAKGYYGAKSKLYRPANEAVMRALRSAYSGRKQKKRDYRKLWITRINAACRQNDISYSRFIEGLTKAGVGVNRKMLSEIAINDPKAFSELVEVSKKGREGKMTPATANSDVEVVVSDTKAKKTANKENSETKEQAKKETTKKSTAKKEKIDYSKMTVAELKEVAAKKKISVTGMKKAEIIEALQK